MGLGESRPAKSRTARTTERPCMTKPEENTVPGVEVHARLAIRERWRQEDEEFKVILRYSEPEASPLTVSRRLAHLGLYLKYINR